MIYYIVRHIITMPNQPTYEFFDSVEKLLENITVNESEVKQLNTSNKIVLNTLEIYMADISNEQKDAVERGDFMYFIKRLQPKVHLGGQPEK